MVVTVSLLPLHLAATEARRIDTVDHVIQICISLCRNFYVRLVAWVIREIDISRVLQTVLVLGLGLLLHVEGAACQDCSLQRIEAGRIKLA